MQSGDKSLICSGRNVAKLQQNGVYAHFGGPRIRLCLMLCLSPLPPLPWDAVFGQISDISASRIPRPPATVSRKEGLRPVSPLRWLRPGDFTVPLSALGQ